MPGSLGTFGDARLDNRGGVILDQMLTSKTVCYRRFDETRKSCLGAWRFFANEKVTAEKIVDSWGEGTREAVVGRHVLAIQDTTEVHFATRPKRRRGLGQCGHGNAHGLLAHTMLAVDADSGACLGLVTGQIWTRKTVQTTPLRKRALAARESRRWVDTAAAAKPILAQAAMVTVVSDRESDIYPSWGRVPDEHVLTRVMSDRGLIGAGEATLHSVADSFPVADTATLALPARPPKRAARTAKLALRFGEVARPVNEKDRTLPRSVRLRLIEVREVEAPEGEEPLRWLLLTTHAVDDLAKAWLIVLWYKLRWTIEQLFRLAKSQGLGLEDSQMATAERLMKLTAAALKAACIDMQLVQERDGRHGLPASTVFAPAEIATLESAQPDAGRQYRKAGKPPSRAEPRLGGLGDCAPGMLGLLRKAARAHHHASWYGALQGDPCGIPSRPGSATRCENPLGLVQAMTLWHRHAPVNATPIGSNPQRRPDVPVTVFAAGRCAGRSSSRTVRWME